MEYCTFSYSHQIGRRYPRCNSVELSKIMKFEEFLKRGRKKQRKRIALVEEVEKLQDELEREQALSRVLTSAMQGRIVSSSCDSMLIPPKVQGILAEMVLVKEEIIFLEEKVKELKLNWYEERRQTRKWGLQRQHEVYRYKNASRKQEYLSLMEYPEQLSRNEEHSREGKVIQDRGGTPSFALEVQSISSTRSYEDIYVKSSLCPRSQSHDYCIGGVNAIDKPNDLSEELLMCLIGIFLKLNQASLHKEARAVPKLTLSCITSKGFMTRTSFNCKATALSNASTCYSDPYRILTDIDSNWRDIGPYKHFIQITGLSDVDHLSDCLPAPEKLRLLMQKLCTVDLTLLNYKQKLAFWINIYNASIMHAFLRHGMPSTHEKLLVLMNKAIINVGGIILNALAIEHFVLRYPWQAKHVPMDKKEMLVRKAYGLRYPEPNVTFALCRGSWSSPALRVYRPDEVVNDLERAKVEYLEASVGVTSKRKIVVPKLLEWHMQDFADDIESLLEWIYSQLPCSKSLKRSIMECLNQETRFPLKKSIEIQPYEHEFRYLLPH